LTTIRDIAEHARVSIGLVYHYFEEKKDLLFPALVEVLESYRRQIPRALEDITNPLARFCTAVRGYCQVNDAAVEQCLPTGKPSR
jgi:AcrR family transcriptional regulator